jgi:hypothetical protein
VFNFCLEAILGERGVGAEKCRGTNKGKNAQQ